MRVCATDDPARYERMIYEVERDWCWACGRGHEEKHRPRGWAGPWLIERAHIIRAMRIRSRFLVVLLCTICHKVQHGERLIIDGKRWPLPKLEISHLLWLKLHRDPAFYRREYILRVSKRKYLPMASRPPKAYLDEYASRHPAAVSNHA